MYSWLIRGTHALLSIRNDGRLGWENQKKMIQTFKQVYHAKLENIRKEKGDVAGLDFLKAFMISLFVVGVLLFALIITGANLISSTTDSGAQSAIRNFTTGLNTISTNIPTFVSIAVVVVIIGLVAVIIAYVGGFSGRGRDGGL